MREILFRGKRTDNQEWVYGVPTTDDFDAMYIIQGIFECDEYNCKGADFYDIDENTVGQYTGLTDKNGTKIFDGDIVKNDWCFLRGYSVIKFGQYKPLDMSNDYQQGHLGFYLEHIHKVDKNTARKDIMYFANKCEVIGNIHDNPELLGGGEE